MLMTFVLQSFLYFAIPEVTDINWSVTVSCTRPLNRHSTSHYTCLLTWHKIGVLHMKHTRNIF